MNCHYCGTSKDLRPYGPGHSMVCFDCAMSTPERREETKRNFAAQLDAIDGPAVIGSEQGPYPLRNHRSTS